jgi:hypothetical protein
LVLDEGEVLMSTGAKRREKVEAAAQERPQSA